MHTPIRRTTPSLSGLAALAVLTGTLPLQAQDSDIAVLRRQITELTERLNKMEADAKKKAETEAKVGAPLTAKGAPVTVSGLLQVQGLGYFDQSGPGANVPNTFRLRRGEVRLTGQITPKIVGTVQIDPAKNLNLNAAGTAINQTGNILQEVALQYQLKRDADSAHYVDVGQFKIPIGYESLLGSGVLQTVERALLFSQRDPFGGGYGDIRDTGVQLRGTMGQFDYRLGVFNGFGERQNALATSDQKAVIGLVSFRPKALSNLVVGLSGGTGSPSGASRNLVNAFAAMKRDRWTMQMEYLQGKAQGAVGAPPVALLRDVRGYYGSIGYMFTPRLEGVLRYDYFDTNTNVAGADGVDLTLGANYYLKGNNAKIQVNLVRRDGSPNALTGSGINDLRNDRYELRTNFQAGF